MEASDPSGRLTVEDLSDCRSESSHSESQLRGFQDYDRIKELNLTVEKSKEPPTEAKDFHLGLEPSRIRFEEFPVPLNKGKDFAYAGLPDVGYPLDRSTEGDESVDGLCRSKNPTGKDLLFNLREGRHKSAHTLALDRYGKELGFEKDIKDFGLLKNYGLERMKEFNLSLDRMRDGRLGNFALERLRGGAGLLENPPMLDHAEFKGIQVPGSGARGQDLEVIALERMRRSHLLGADLSAQNLSTQHTHSITQMQHSQQQQQQQAKSFTIDAILGLRNNNREKRGQQQQYRKHQGQESSAKGGGGGSCSSGGGKLKRVRTIFTAEQLERLEGEFARQQYMVGPERLYLAHALRLTEAQVKVWFQNRRIKWRKHHHEQQSQRVHEFQRSLNSSLEHEDSNETDKWNSTTEPVEGYYSASHAYKPQRSHCSYAKHAAVCGADAGRQALQSYAKPDKGKRYPNLTGRRSKYDEELGSVDKLKYGRAELEAFNEDQTGEDADEEEDDHDGAGEFLNKEYEQQEANEEVDEESDPIPQALASRKGDKNLLKQQRWRSFEQDRRPRCPQRVQANQEHSSRYYHNVAEADATEPLSEEDFVPTSLRSPPPRSPRNYRQWSPSRNASDRYDLPQHSRRARTKPEMDHVLEPDLNKARRCNRCGNVSSRKTDPPVKNGCRFDDRSSFPAKGPIGDEPESHVHAFCSHCVQRHSAKEFHSSAQYASKLRRNRDLKPPILYDTPEQGQVDLSAYFARCSSRYHTKGDHPEKQRRSARPPRYAD